MLQQEVGQAVQDQIQPQLLQISGAYNLFKMKNSRSIQIT
jgi:hypothetical protein